MAVTAASLANDLLNSYKIYTKKDVQKYKAAQAEISKADATKADTKADAAKTETSKIAVSGNNYNVTDFNKALAKFRAENPTTLDNFFGGNVEQESGKVDINAIASDLLSYSKNAVTAKKLGLAFSTFNPYSVRSATSFAKNSYATYVFNKRLAKMNVFSNYTDMKKTATVPGETLNTKA